MSKAKTKPEPAAEQPPDDDPAAILLGWLGTPIDKVVQSSTILRAFAVEEIESVGQVIDVYDGWEPGIPDPLTQPPFNLSEFQAADVHKWLRDALPEALDPEQVLPWLAEAEDDAEQQADTPTVVEATPMADPTDLVAYDAETLRLINEADEQEDRLEAEYDDLHEQTAIAKKEYEKAVKGNRNLRRERKASRGKKDLFTGVKDDAQTTPSAASEDRLAELQMKYPLTAEKWTKYGLTEKDVQKLSAGETRHHGVHPLYTYGDIGRFVKDPATGFERRLTDIKGLGEAAYNRWLDAELKFQQDWPNIAAAFAAEIGFDLGGPADAGSQPGAGSGDGGEGGDGQADAGEAAEPDQPTLGDFAAERNPLPDATAEPKRKRKAKAKGRAK